MKREQVEADNAAGGRSHPSEASPSDHPEPEVDGGTEEEHREVAALRGEGVAGGVTRAVLGGVSLAVGLMLLVHTVLLVLGARDTGFADFGSLLQVFDGRGVGFANMTNYLLLVLDGLAALGLSLGALGVWLKVMPEGRQVLRLAYILVVLTHAYRVVQPHMAEVEQVFCFNRSLVVFNLAFLVVAIVFGLWVLIWRPG